MKFGLIVFLTPYFPYVCCSSKHSSKLSRAATTQKLSDTSSKTSTRETVYTQRNTRFTECDIGFTYKRWFHLQASLIFFVKRQCLSECFFFEKKNLCFAR